MLPKRGWPAREDKIRRLIAVLDKGLVGEIRNTLYGAIRRKGTEPNLEDVLTRRDNTG